MQPTRYSQPALCSATNACPRNAFAMTTSMFSTRGRSQFRVGACDAVSRPDRGSVLVVAMVFATLLGLALTSFVVLNTHSLKMANRTFYAAEAVNMAEA